jgi:hypothetical protein
MNSKRNRYLFELFEKENDELKLYDYIMLLINYDAAFIDRSYNGINLSDKIYLSTHNILSIFAKTQKYNKITKYLISQNFWKLLK